jgi:hypothetical protein
MRTKWYCIEYSRQLRCGRTEKRKKHVLSGANSLREIKRCNLLPTVKIESTSVAAQLKKAETTMT